MVVDFGRILIIIGLVITFTGVFILVAVRHFPWLGNLPGDIWYERENIKLYFPLATMLLISFLGSILLNVLMRIFRR